MVSLREELQAGVAEIDLDLSRSLDDSTEVEPYSVGRREIYLRSIPTQMLPGFHDHTRTSNLQGLFLESGDCPGFC